MLPLLLPRKRPPVLGEVQVVPPRQACRPACGGSIWTAPALRRSYRARRNRDRNKIRITKVSTVSGEPRKWFMMLGRGRCG
jgi:hypothetical protein